MNARSGPILKVQRLSKMFGGLVAVSEVSFDVKPQEIFGVIGPNGAGKSTLFNLLAATFPASGGQIEFGGRSTAGWPSYRLARAGLARTFQTLRLFGDQSALDNVLVGAYRRTRADLLGGLVGYPGAGADGRRLREEAMRSLEFVGLGDHAGQVAEDLSFGQQRLLELARALALEPTLLLLDEPASGLNERETEGFAALLRALPRRGITVLLVEHNMRLMMNVADRMVVLDCGRKIAEGTPAAIQGNQRVIEVYLGSSEEA